MELEIPDVSDSVIISSSSEEIIDEENQLYPVATPVFEEIPPLNREPDDSSLIINYYYTQFQMQLLFSRVSNCLACITSVVLVSSIVLYLNI